MKGTIVKCASVHVNVKLRFIKVFDSYIHLCVDEVEGVETINKDVDLFFRAFFYANFDDSV